MSLDAEITKLYKIGTVTIKANGQVVVKGFLGNENSSCRDVAVLAVTHAISILAAELRKDIEAPGGGNIVVD